MPKYRRLSENNRKDIQTMFESGATKREIARSIDKSPSAVCRELARNRKRGGQYRSRRAHRVAKRRLVNKGTRPRLIRASLEKNVKTRLRKLHSPEQVANTLVVGSFIPFPLPLYSLTHYPFSPYLLFPLLSPYPLSPFPMFP